MSDSVDTRGAIDLNEIPMPPGMNILQLDAEDYTDWTGDPALRINVLIDDSTVVEKVGGSALNHFTANFAALPESDDKRFFLACLWAWQELEKR